MFFEIFRFEIKRMFRRPAIYLYWFILFLIAFGLFNAAGGAFKGFAIRLAGENVFLNAPGIIDTVMGVFSYLGIFIVAAISANVVMKDYQYNTMECMFSTPIRKADYLLGRFTAVLALCCIVFTGAGIGLYIGSLMPYLNQTYIGPNELYTYIYPYLTRVFPNIFFICALFFGMSVLLRNVVVNWILILAFYVLYAVAMNLFRDLENQTLASIIDPFGIAASIKVTTSNSASDMNETGAKLEDVFLYNRILWCGLGFVMMVFTYLRFKFVYSIERRKKVKDQKVMTSVSDETPSLKEMPTVNVRNTPLTKWKELFSFEFKKLIGNAYFWIIAVIMIFFMFLASKGIGKHYDTNTYPVTYQVIDVLGGTMRLFLAIVVLLFSGEMIWRDRDQRIDEIALTYPVSNWISLSTKFVALAMGVFFYRIILILCGVLVQTMSGYYHYELDQYLTSQLLFSFTDDLLFIALAFFIHVVVNQKYVGHVMIVLYWVVKRYFAYHIFKHPLLIFGAAPSIPYSDMNGYGFELFPYWIFKFYWIFVAAILMVISNYFLITQTDNAWSIRWSNFKSKVQGNGVRVLVSCFTITVLFASFIFYNTNVKSTFRTPYSRELRTVMYEKTYKKYENLTQPKITDVSIHADLYPDNGDVFAKGDYVLTNKENRRVDTLFIQSNKHISSLTFNRKVEVIKEDKDYHITLYRLAEPLLKGENLKMSFVFEGKNNGFSVNGANNICQKNGTFIYNSLFPSIGYSYKDEISDKRTREKHQLPKRKVVKSRDDAYGLNHNFITSNSDFIRFEAVVSTSVDQTALTPGMLVKKWTKNNRNYFHYKSEKPMLHYYAILSGHYEVLNDTWTSEDGETVDLSIFYHKGHEYNLKNMMQGVKSSLSTYSKIYSPYQYRQLRIVEFPRYSSYAQSFPNMIPFSEGIGFIADLRTLKDKNVKKNQDIMDYPFFVTAHEMAHQWWAHQVVAADVEGAQMLMESITQYSAILCMEDYFGSDRMRKFFKNEMFRYLMSRKDEKHEERPLVRVAPYQQDTYYKKGALVMHALGNYIGEERFLHSLQTFLDAYAYKGAPYPTTNDFVGRLREQTPDSLQYLVTDALEKITMYNTTVTKATYRRNKDFTYKVEAVVDIEKFYVDGKGEARPTDCSDYIDVVIYNSKKEVLYQQKRKLVSGKNVIRFDLKRKPDHLVMDPDYLIITKEWDRDPFEITKKS